MKKAIVLGAGVMGLACARDLADKGYQVSVYEADDRVGGMSAHFDFYGLNIERYYHFICKPDNDYFKLLKELDISHKLFWRETKMGYFYQGKLHAWGNPLALLRFPGLGLIAKLRYGLQMFLSTKRSDWKSLDKVNAKDWIVKWIGQEAYEVLWGALFRKKFYEYTDNLSAAWIWTRIKRVGLSRKSLMQEEMGYLEGGSDTLLKALEADIKQKGVQIYLSSPVSKVHHNNNKITGIEVNGEVTSCDVVISTIPLPFVNSVIPDMDADYQEKYQAVSNIGVVCVIFKLTQSVTENFWLNVNDPDMDIPGIIEFSNLRPLDTNLVYVPFYLSHEHQKNKQTNDEFVTEAQGYLKKINTSLRDEDFIDSWVSRYRFAQPICPPGFLDSLPSIKTNIEGLFVADTSYYYPEDRSISESVRLGREIADMV